MLGTTPRPTSGVQGHPKAAEGRESYGTVIGADVQLQLQCHARVARAVLYPSASIAPATWPVAASGIAVAASSRTSNRAPGISRAIASPLPTGKNGSRRPWTTSVG